MGTLGEKGEGMGQIGEGDKEVKTSNYKISEWRGMEVQHREYSQEYCNDFVC